MNVGDTSDGNGEPAIENMWKGESCNKVAENFSE